jgi:hypothetical protein
MDWSENLVNFSPELSLYGGLVTFGTDYQGQK